MRSPLRPRSLFASLLVAGGLLAAAAGAAAAHPLGNFTVSHYHGLTLSPDGVEVLSVIDVAEIPTQQRRPGIDTDADGALSDAELAAEADRECAAVAADLRATVDEAPLVLTVDTAAMLVVPGEADLPTLRLTCGLSAPADLGARSSVTFSDDYRTDRIGWHEVTATGAGMRLVESSVPSASVSDALRSYPRDLLSSPLDVRSAVLVAEPGEPVESAAGRAAASDGPFSRLMAQADRRLGDLVGDRQLTPVVGALAVLLALLLGAGHAVLPGHGKTVMAAYLAGRRGRPRDALLVGATVTGTHTAGVLLLGLALTLSTGLAGEQVLRVLTVASGVLVVLVGVGLLRSALRDRAAARRPEDAHGHEHGHEHEDEDEHSLAAVAAGAASAVDPGQRRADEGRLPAPVHGHGHGHGHGFGHGHGHGHGHGPAAGGAFGRRSLVGIGIAGGLVPSPSALVVLLGAVALGRSVFGVLLVVAYGVGMAATLTAVGLLLVRARGRLDRWAGARSGGPADRLLAWLPVGTAVLVVLVGVGLAGRGALLA